MDQVRVHSLVWNMQITIIQTSTTYLLSEQSLKIQNWRREIQDLARLDNLEWCNLSDKAIISKCLIHKEHMLYLCKVAHSKI